MNNSESGTEWNWEPDPNFHQKRDEHQPKVPYNSPQGSSESTGVAMGGAVPSEMSLHHSVGSSGEHAVFGVPTSVQGPEYFQGEHTDGKKQIVVVMVGLPARGKTFLAQKLCRLLGWQGYQSQVFNVQKAWKQRMVASHQYRESAELFGQLQDESSEAREAYRQTLKAYATEVQTFFKQGNGIVTILNDDFITESLRQEAVNLFDLSGAVQLLFVEVQRESKSNGTFDDLKVKDPVEYRESGNFSASDALTDFHRRVEMMERAYESLTPESEHSYIKLKNTSILEVHRVTGFLPARIVSFLMNLSQFKIAHPIYFTRHGQSMYNLEDRLGGDPPLTEKGEQDAESVCRFIEALKQTEAKQNHENELQIWTSQLRRAVQTAEPAEKKLGINCSRWSSLNEIHAGVCENMTYSEVREVYPLIDKFRAQNKYTFRYPEGESYQDLVMRLEPVIMELENANCVVVVVAHQAILRALLAYFGTVSAESCVRVSVPHRTLWRCTYSSTGIASVDVVKLGEASKGDGSKD